MSASMDQHASMNQFACAGYIGKDDICGDRRGYPNDEPIMWAIAACAGPAYPYCMCRNAGYECQPASGTLWWSCQPIGYGDHKTWLRAGGKRGLLGATKVRPDARTVSSE